MMRSTDKFFKALLHFSLKDIKRIDVSFDPLKNAVDIREFIQGVTARKLLKTNQECIIKTKVLSDNSSPKVKVKFVDDHNLFIDCEHLESSQILELVKLYREKHMKVDSSS